MEPFLNNLIEALGWAIFHSLWQGAIIYALLFIVLIGLPKLDAKLKHNLAFGSILLMLISFCYTFYSLFEIPLSESEGLRVISYSALGDLNNLQFSSNRSLLKPENWFPLLTGFYLLGIAVQMLLIISGYQKLKTLKKTNTVSIPADWNTVLCNTVAQLKIKQNVHFFLSAKVAVPLVIGYFKPVVLFPIALVSQLDLLQVEAILIHELSHVRRNDYALNLIKTFIETILFFNPFIWLAGKFIRIEREHACDDLVVQHTGTPLTYAHALLKLELLKAQQAPILSLAATGNKQYLYQRIKRITNMKTNYIHVKQQLVVLALTLSTLFSLAWMNPKKDAAEKVENITTIKKNPIEAEDTIRQISLRSDTDTTKKKKSIIKYTITDDKGKTKTYNSVAELPDSLRATLLNYQFGGDTLAALINSKKWKSEAEKAWRDQSALLLGKASTDKYFESKEWKDQMAKVQNFFSGLAKQLESKEIQNNILKIQENASATAKQFDSKEWKNNIIKMQLNAAELGKKFSSPEWKQKVEELKMLQESPEYKELKNKFEKDLEDLKKQKGIKSDKTHLN